MPAPRRCSMPRSTPTRTSRSAISRGRGSARCRRGSRRRRKPQRAPATSPSGSRRANAAISRRSLVIDGLGAQAMARLDAHVADYPRDALALSPALGVFGLLGFSGRIDHHEAQLALLKRLAPEWDED